MESLYRWIARATAVALVLLLSESALAVPIGTFDVIGSVGFAAATIDWAPAGGVTGSALVVASTSGPFAAVEGTTAIPKDLNSPAQP